MQIIVNCLIFVDGKLVMLQKPRRGWWVLPGGKVEVSETWPEAVTREVWEETGLTVSGVELRGVHRIRIAEEDGHFKERLIAQFSAAAASGEMLSECKEGKVESIRLSEWDKLPMDEGDRIIIHHSLSQMDEMSRSCVYFGMFTYTSDHKLVSWDMSPKAPLASPLES